MHIKFFSIEYTKLNDIIKSNHKINIRRDLIMSFYKKMVSVCAAVALSTSIIPVIPVSADTGMTRYEAERQYTGGWADVVQNSIASGGYVVERIGGKSTDIGTVVFKIWAEEAGTYNAKLGYISKKDSEKSANRIKLIGIVSGVVAGVITVLGTAIGVNLTSKQNNIPGDDEEENH